MADYSVLKPEKLQVNPKHRHLKDRLKAIEWSENLLAHEKDWTIIDTESTGIHENATIIHLAVLSRHGEELLESLVRPKPRAQIDSDILESLGVTRKDLNKAPTIDDLADEIVKALSGKDALSYNSEFRERILLQSGIDIGKGRMNCVMNVYAAFMGDWHNGKNDYKWHPLPKHGRKWHAMDDCKSTHDLIRFMASYPKPNIRPWWKLW